MGKHRQLFIITDRLQLVTGEKDGIAIRDVDTVCSPENAADVYTETVAELQAAERFPCPERVLRQFKIGDMNVPIYQMIRKKRFSFSLDLCPDVAAPKIFDEQPFQCDATFFEPAGEKHQDQYAYGHGYHQCILEPCKIIADVEDETDGNNNAGKNRSCQRQPVDAPARP